MSNQLNLLETEIKAWRETRLDHARQNLLSFTTFTFKNYEINWHHKTLCGVLNSFVAGKVKRLIITLPPRHGKSELVSRRLPAFILGKNPKTKIIGASYSAELASSMNRDVQRIIEAKEYQILFPETKLSGMGDEIEGRWVRNSTVFETVNFGGVYRSAGIGGSLTGHGADIGIIDDYLKNQEEADSKTIRDKIWNWYTTTFYTRLEKDASILITATRWHEDDLIGRLLKDASEDTAAEQWVVVNLPAFAESQAIQFDPREAGDPLWPQKYSLERLNIIKKALGTRFWTALYQQRPAPEQGLLFNREWWRFYDTLPETFDTIIQAWDATFKDKKTSDFVVGVVLGKKGPNIYLLDMVRNRLSFTNTLEAIKNLKRKWPKTGAIYIEDAANGPAIIDTLKAQIPGIIAVTPRGSKIARATSIAPRIEAGNVLLPSPNICPWANDVIEEWTVFPAGVHDDIVDAMTHGIIKLAEKKTFDWLPVSLTGVNKFQ